MIRVWLRTIAIAASCLAALAPVAARADGRWIDEVKLGVLAHDVPLFDDHIEGGADVNGEVLFTSPLFLAAIGAPRPHLGVTANLLGKTSYAYTGLTWTAVPWRALVRPDDEVFGSLGLGGAIHDYSNTDSPGRLGLGTRLLFHESLDLGYGIATWRCSAFVDHVSNADIGRRNPGMTNLGIRVGYLF